MNMSWFRNYVVILVFGVLHASAVSADDGATKTRWSDLAPEVRAEITAIRAKVVKLEAGQPGVEAIRWNMLANDIQNFLITQTANVGALRARVEALEGSFLAGDMDPTLASIQSTVFNGSCAGCHNGPPGSMLPSGLDLSDVSSSFSSMVGVASQEVPALLRVKPGDPANSYLIQKLEGTHSVGSQMPSGAPPLAASVVGVIRIWIQLGALQ